MEALFLRKINKTVILTLCFVSLSVLGQDKDSLNYFKHHYKSKIEFDTFKNHIDSIFLNEFKKSKSLIFLNEKYEIDIYSLNSFLSIISNKQIIGFKDHEMDILISFSKEFSKKLVQNKCPLILGISGDYEKLKKLQVPVKNDDSYLIIDVFIISEDVLINRRKLEEFINFFNENTWREIRDRQ